MLGKHDHNHSSGTPLTLTHSHSSVTGMVPVPLLTIYCASKAFVDYFSQALAIETSRKSDVIIQSVMPFFVSTKMSNLRSTMKVPTAEKYVASQLKRVGRSRRTYGYWWHSIMGVFYEVTSSVLGQEYNSGVAFKTLFKMRAKYYRKNNLVDNYVK